MEGIKGASLMLHEHVHTYPEAPILARPDRSINQNPSDYLCLLKATQL